MLFPVLLALAVVVPLLGYVVVRAANNYTGEVCSPEAVAVWNDQARAILENEEREERRRLEVQTGDSDPEAVWGSRQ